MIKYKVRLKTFGPLSLLLCILSTVFISAVNRMEEISLNPFIQSLLSANDRLLDKLPEDRVYLQFDKSLYAPGERIWYAAYVRQAKDLKASRKSDILHIELIDPKGNVAETYQLIAQNGHAKGDFQIDPSWPGGIYKVKAFTQWQKNEPNPYFFEKELTVQKVVLPRVKMKLDFQRESFGPGDKVIAKLELENNKNEPLSNQQFNATIKLDGKPVKTLEMNADASGNAYIQYILPKDLKTNDGILEVSFLHQDFRESISRAIPITTGGLDLRFYPEGGDLVQGQLGKVAFAAKDEFGKPADIKAEVVDEKGRVLIKFESYQFGMGVFNLKPSADKQYFARILQPAGTDSLFPIPKPLRAGFSMHVTHPTQTDLGLTIESDIAEKASLVLRIRGKVHYSNELKLEKGRNEFVIPIGNMPMGVAQITLFDSKNIERCERLTFLNKDRQLQVNIQTNKQEYQPREEVQMSIEVLDERGMPMPGNFSLAVVDDANLSFADDKDGKILSRLLLEPELKQEVFEASFYFDPTEAKADSAMELLMMTSGWRRFSWKQISDMRETELTHSGEKAVLSGVVRAFYDRDGVSNVKVTHEASNTTVYTDQDGRFTFPFIDLSLGTNFIFIAKKGNEISRDLNRYGTRHEVFLSDGRPMPEMMFRNNVAKAGAVDLEAAPMADGVAMQVEMDEMKNVAEEIEAAEPEEMEVPDILDDQFNAKMGMPIMPEIPVQEDAMRYYRAREFAVPDYRKSNIEQKRTDFRSTIFWEGDLEVDRNGRAELKFYTSDAITSFRATLEGISEDGSLAHAEHTIYNLKPMNIQCRIPANMVTGDRFDLPVTVVNNTSGSMKTKIAFELSSAFEAIGSLPTSVQVDAGSARTINVPLKIVQPDDSARIEVSAEGAETSDELVQFIKVVPRGFPAAVSFSSRELKKSYKFKIRDAVENSLYAHFLAYPSTTSELLSSIEDILREPYGCFEQTSSSNYPNVLVLDYLRTMELNEPEIENKALALLDKGYDKLVSFETKDRGYEWFGASPGHEALTAYGILEFIDMKKVYPKVNDQMIDRTVDWLMARRDGNGGFKRNPKALDSYGAADQDITNAYAVYALSEAGITDIQKELNQSVEDASSSGDPYIIALVINALYNLKDTKRADDLLKALLKKQEADGSFMGLKHSITRSTGQYLRIETTAFAILAILKSQNIPAGAPDRAAEFIVNARSGYGGFGNTQSTIMALKALTAFAQFSKQIKEDGTVEVYVNKKKHSTVEFKAGGKDPIEIHDLEKWLKEGENEITVNFLKMKKGLPYTVYVSWNSDLPENSDSAAIGIETKLLEKKVDVGGSIRMEVLIQNLDKKNGQPMTMAVLGIPAGLSTQPWQLKELMDKKVFDFYEIIDNRLAIYYRDMAPGAEKRIALDLKAEVPGEFLAPASCAYLYYTPNQRRWVASDPIQVK